MSAPAELAPDRLEEFERVLVANRSVRVGVQDLWRALARVFPHRAPGPAERRLLLNALTATEVRQTVKLPPPGGKRWDRTMDPAVPTSVDLVRADKGPMPFRWKTFPWHPSLRWVADCRSFSVQQISFLQRVHEGLVRGAFRESAPLKYRSLQLTGDEKMLTSLATTALFAEGRLSLDKLACLPDALPLAWEAVSEGGRLVIFENAGPFAVARRVLEQMASPPYDLIAYGGGRSVLASLGYLRTIDRAVETIHYVGDVDHAGLDIALAAQKCASDLGLPPVQPATELHRQMLAAARSFGHPNGWTAHARPSTTPRRTVIQSIAPELRSPIEQVIERGRRIPEEILGPDELRFAWTI